MQAVCVPSPYSANTLNKSDKIINFIVFRLARDTDKRSYEIPYKIHTPLK